MRLSPLPFSKLIILTLMFIVIFSHGAAFSGEAVSEGQVIENLPPIVIEGEKVMESSPPIQVQTGAGMKEIDPPLNELGIEQRNMEKLIDISMERRNEGWWLNPMGRTD